MTTIPQTRNSRPRSSRAAQVEIHPNKPVEPLDADLRETRVWLGDRQTGTAFNSGTPLSRTRIS